jgi:hypothetical protein
MGIVSDLSYEELLIENVNYKELYRKAKSELDALEQEIPQLEEYRERISGYLKNN